jgi:hypothetical protein
MTMRHAKLGWWCGCAALYFWLFGWYALNAYRHPFMNWDMVAYMGVVESYSTDDPQAVYDNTMGRLKGLFHRESYERITQKNVLSNNATAFHQQMPFYNIKLLYTGAIYLLNQSGMPMFLATYMISIVGWLAIGALLMWFRPRALDAGLWWLLMAWFVSFRPSPLSIVAALSTPDTLCIALSLAGFCLLAYRKSVKGFGICMILAQLARPDTMLLTLIMLAWFAWLVPAENRIRLRDVIIIGYIAVVLYTLVNYLGGNYGWRGLFFYHFIRKSAYPAHIEPVFTWAQYFNITEHGLRRFILNMRVKWMLIASWVALVLYIWRPMGPKLFVYILGLGWASLFLRFVIFPAWMEYRYFYPNYLIILYALAEILPVYALSFYRGVRQRVRMPAASA